MAHPLYLCGVVDSVLDCAHALIAESSLPVWGSVLAGSQRSGRGQMRRSWSSPPGNIYAALRLPLTRPFASGAASPAVGALLVEAFARQGIRLLLKWPNDVLLASPSGGGARVPVGKAGGVLLEERAGALVAGIGINVASTPSREQLREGGLPAACLNDLPRVTLHDHSALLGLWSCLVDSLLVCYRQWGVSGHSAWLASAERHLVWKGEPVLLDDGECRQGVLLGLAASGGVRLVCDGVEKVFLNGNLSPVHGHAPKVDPLYENI